jgi:hypothetical protein
MGCSRIDRFADYRLSVKNPLALSKVRTDEGRGSING